MPTNTYKEYFIASLRKREKDNIIGFFKYSLRN